MKIAVIGGGGREHALVRKLKQSPACGEIFVLPGNGGTATDAHNVGIKATDIAAVTEYCVSNAVEYVVVAPDDPLALGLVDALEAQGIPAFGPNAAAARIEASKVFAKDLMKKYNIPTARYETFEDAEQARNFLRTKAEYPVVIKADGLALGKGVVICLSPPEAEAALHGIMEEKIFGASGTKVVIEEFLTGPEVSILAFCDGKTVVPMVSSMDHKRALDGDMGPNTGGMGCIAPSPFYGPELAKRCTDEIFLPTVAAMSKEGAPFKGCLYFGLMLTAEGPKVIEYNCRFGDPETQVVLPLLDCDLLGVMQACTEGCLEPAMVRIKDGAAACVVMASGGYPAAYETGKEIAGTAAAESLPGVQVYHAGTKLEDGVLRTCGGRVLGVTALAADLPSALENSYSAVGEIHFENAHYRRDIGKKAMEMTKGR